jgi:hypothetical protein
MIVGEFLPLEAAESKMNQFKRTGRINLGTLIQGHSPEYKAIEERNKGPNFDQLKEDARAIYGEGQVAGQRPGWRLPITGRFN